MTEQERQAAQRRAEVVPLRTGFARSVLPDGTLGVSGYFSAAELRALADAIEGLSVAAAGIGAGLLSDVEPRPSPGSATAGGG